MRNNLEQHSEREPGKEKPKTIVEIGGGESNYFTNLNIDPPVGSNYVNLDLVYRELQAQRRQTRQSLPNAEAIRANAQLLPFADKSVDEIIFSNILDAPLEEYKPALKVGHHVGALAALPVRRSKTLRQDSLVTAPKYEMSKQQKAQAERFESEKERAYFAIADNIVKEGLRVIKDAGEIKIVELANLTHLPKDNKYGIPYPAAYGQILDNLRKNFSLVVREENIRFREKLGDYRNGKIYTITKKPPR